MKKRLIALVLVLTFSLGTVTALAAGGSAEDPLISLAFLKNTLKPRLSQALREGLYPAKNGGRESAEQITMDQQRYKEGGVLSAATGCEVVVLAGSVSADLSGGAVIDATNGAELGSGKTLTANARYIVGEDTTARFTVTSPTAVVSMNGAARVTSSDTPDYNAMADALFSLSLLQGTGTGFGKSYDLEKPPTRIEAIVMFIRMIGEEDEALACTAEHPFSDVAPWADRYVAYAFEQGYSNGAGGDKFASTRRITPKEYMEFVMRALQYSSVEHTDLSTTLADAKGVGLLTEGEYELLTTSPLLRAHLVYVSWYALSCPVAGMSGTLEDGLVSAGVFDRAALKAAHEMVTTERL